MVSTTPRVHVAVFGRFNAPSLATELENLGWLEKLIIGHPRQVPGVSPSRVRRVPFLYETMWALNRVHLDNRQDALSSLFDRLLDAYLAERDVSILHAWAGHCLRTISHARARGTAVILDRAGSHILWQRELMRQESEATGSKYDTAYFRMTSRMLEEYELAEYIVVPSTYAKNTFIRHGVPAEKIHCMVAGVAPPATVTPPHSRGAGFLALFVGGIGPQKGLSYMLEGWRLAGLPNDATLIVVTGEVPIGLRDLAKQEQVELLPPMRRSELFDLYNRASALFHPAVDDAFGFVVEEAMHFALPVVISEHCGAWDVVTDGREGFVIPARNSQAVAESLAKLYAQPGLRIHLGQNAKATAARRCTPASYRAAISHFYPSIRSA